jgi:hypothetical protein
MRPKGAAQWPAVRAGQLPSTDRPQQHGHCLLDRDEPRSEPDQGAGRENHASPPPPALVEKILTAAFTLELLIGRKPPQRYAEWSA